MKSLRYIETSITVYQSTSLESCNHCHIKRRRHPVILKREAEFSGAVIFLKFRKKNILEEHKLFSLTFSRNMSYKSHSSSGIHNITLQDILAY